MTAVRCIDLCKTYIQGDTEIKALDHLSIEIKAVASFACHRRRAVARRLC